VAEVERKREREREMALVTEGKLLLRVFTADAYKTVPIVQSQTVDDVETYLRKKLIGATATGSQTHFDDYHLFHVVNERETLLEPTCNVWELHHSRPEGSFVFKCADMHVAIDYGNTSSAGPSAMMSPRESTGGNRKLHRMRSASKVTTGKAELGNVFKKKPNPKENRQITIRYKEKAIQYAFPPGASWENHIEQICDAFEVKGEPPSSFTLQDKQTGAYVNSILDLFGSAAAFPTSSSSSRPDGLFSLCLKPEIEVSRCLQQITSANRNEILDGMKAFKLLCGQPSSASILIFHFLHQKGLDSLFRFVASHTLYSHEIVLMALRVMNACLLMLKESPSAAKSLPALDPSCDVLKSLSSLLLCDPSDSIRVASSEAIQSLVHLAPSCFPHFILSLKSIQVSEKRTPSDSTSTGVTLTVSSSGSSSISKYPPFLLSLVETMLSAVQVDIMAALSLLDVLTMIIAHSPYMSEPHAHGEAKEEIVRVLFEDFTFSGVLHGLAVRPGRYEVEESLLRLQNLLIALFLREKDVTFVRDDPVHEGLLASLWNTTYPQIPLENRVSHLWKRMGFQRYLLVEICSPL